MFEGPQLPDTILRTKDDIELKVHKWPIAQVSPFFLDMFSLPRPKDTMPEQLRVVPLPEEAAEDMINLLQYVYPNMENPRFWDVKVTPHSKANHWSA